MVDKYYGSEIDEDALTVTRIRLPTIEHLGDVTEITADKVDIPYSFCSQIYIITTCMHIA